MKKEDFYNGQTVYLRLIGNAARGKTGDDLIREATVISVGRKYLTISPGYFSSEVKFDLTDFREKTNYAEDHKLFMTRQAVLDDIEKGELIRMIMRKNDWPTLSKLSLDTLRKIKEMLAI